MLVFPNYSAGPSPIHPSTAKKRRRIFFVGCNRRRHSNFFFQLHVSLFFHAHLQMRKLLWGAPDTSFVVRFFLPRSFNDAFSQTIWKSRLPQRKWTGDVAGNGDHFLCLDGTRTTLKKEKLGQINSGRWNVKLICLMFRLWKLAFNEWNLSAFFQ